MDTSFKLIQSKTSKAMQLLLEFLKNWTLLAISKSFVIPNLVYGYQMKIIQPYHELGQLDSFLGISQELGLDTLNSIFTNFSIICPFFLLVSLNWNLKKMSSCHNKPNSTFQKTFLIIKRTNFLAVNKVKESWYNHQNSTLADALKIIIKIYQVIQKPRFCFA